MRLPFKALIVIGLLTGIVRSGQAQGSSLATFTYQGRLNDSNGPANGLHDFQFALFPASSGTNNQVDTTVTAAAVPVSNGLFTVELAFPQANASFNGSDRWLEIAVRPSLVGSNYVTLTPRQKITATPYAVTAGAVINGGLAGNGASVTNVNAVSLGGISSSGFWKTNGNAGAVGAFLGTTDNLPVDFRANGSRVLRLAPDLTSPNIIAGSPANDIAGGIGAAVLGGGNASYPNRAMNNYATVVGGISNTASGGASVAMGQFNTASGYASVASGFGGTAAGFTSFAAGNSARALHDGAFVWGDNTFADFVSTANNQFLVRAGGGVGINTNNPNGAALAVNGAVALGGDIRVMQTNPLLIQQGGQRIFSITYASNTFGGYSPNLVGGHHQNYVSNDVIGASIGGGGSLAQFAYHTWPGGFQTGYGIPGFGYGTNVVTADYGTVPGGFGNTAAGAAALAAGVGCTASGPMSMAFGWGSRATNGAAVALGNQNLAGGSSSLALGQYAEAIHNNSFVWSDGINFNFGSSAPRQFLIRAGGGVGINTTNPAGAALAVVGSFKGGDAGNIISNGVLGGFIGGGGSSGFENRVGANYGAVLGGVGNLASGHAATAMGELCTATGRGSVAGGWSASATAQGSTAFGRFTQANNDDATAMGLGCIASGWDSVAMGTYTVAGGHYSTAAGYYSQATHQSSFVWSDSSTTSGASSAAAHSVTMRAAGGYRLFSNSSSTAGVTLAANGTSWGILSDRNAKKDFAAVNAGEILEKLSALPITQWHYKWEENDSTPHIGPMAQDFKAAFYPGADDKVITTQEADGVALAAIQGLNEKLESRSQRLEAENAALKARLERLEKLIAERN